MTHKIIPLLAMAIGAATMPAAAQEVKVPAGYAPGVSVGYGLPDATWIPVDAAHPMPTAAKQEMVTLATGNIAAAAQAVYGGDYLFAQSCSGYGTVALQVLAADGTTYQTILSRAGADAAPVGVAIGSNAILRLDLTGTSGCAANLSRVP